MNRLTTTGNRIVVATTLLAVLPGAASAIAPGFSWPSFRDIKLTVHARRALSEDPVLAELNLSVQVRNGVATVSGPVTADSLAGRAVRRLESVPGIYEVRNETYVARPPKNEEVALAPFVNTPSVKSEPPVVGELIGQAEPELPVIAPTPPPVVLPPPSAGVQASVSLLAPVVIPESKVPATPTAAGSAGASTPAIDQLRRTDPRFRPIVARAEGGTVYLQGGNATGEDVMAFAQAISQLPGVERVVVQSAPR